MSVSSETKLNLLIRDWPPGTVAVTSWLNRQGYSNQLLNRYKKSSWLNSLGTGAWIRTGDTVAYEGAVYALQSQVGLSIHPGGRAALSLLGKAHYLELAQAKVDLFGYAHEVLPAWCRSADWGLSLVYHQSSFLPPGIGMTDIPVNSFSIRASSAARAMMECLYLAATSQEFVECYELMEGMNNLRPDSVQKLLEECSSVKVKRLFLYMAEKAGHQWVGYLTVGEIDLGKGKRSLVKNGSYVPKYQITVPEALEENGKQNL
ncbi:type IV toxin-antitoxin system AbiEi family antitoxin [Dyadobacter sp. CY261]|uniref:type IV toxin-antitoxin system AbiEi family antitoxin n=1 Tax=Dyadobacter sp. CY261 TaxID=2907203 RepID=UPI001F274A6E|nr:type IV toxin-antitoxin system AbiEi family antitoxin [Dyadobacter sp. CY261]MCF0075740.1 type IV toxin-antitoxin system AbiEi family antitoxin [Dyadobacter sp. CY261]